MSQSTAEFKHIYSLTPKWRQNFIDNLGGTIEGENMHFNGEGLVVLVVF